MKLNGITFGLLMLTACGLAVDRYVPVEWEHGWKTSRVVATRYTNPTIGYNIGFTFPLNPNECDAIEVLKFVERKQGSVYQGGGSPGAEMFVIFKDVKDRESANVKLKTILPAMSALIESLGRRR